MLNEPTERALFAFGFQLSEIVPAAVTPAPLRAPQSTASVVRKVAVYLADVNPPPPQPDSVPLIFTFCTAGSATTPGEIESFPTSAAQLTIAAFTV